MDYRLTYGLIWALVLVTSTCSAYIDEQDMRVCIGTNGRMSVPSNRNHHYRNLRDRFSNCTHVDGNLELTWLESANMNLDFLQHIREVTGYVLISHVHVKNIILPRLQIIRGRTLFKLNIYDEQFGLFVSYSQMDSLELPALRDILSGSVFIFNNQNLCFIQTINWEEIITGPGEVSRYVYNFTFPEPACPKCHPSCVAGCWGEGAHNCQKFSKINCSPQCGEGRCFGPNPRDCCHLFCAGGCTGPTQKECLACRNFYDDGVCKHECPPMQKYNPTNYLWEPNPDGKYAYGATCVRNCPEHLLKDNGACVRTCPANKTAKNGECVTCNGPCPKTCSGVGVVHSGNIDSFRDCTIIEGTLEILDQTFNGYQQVYANFSFGPRFIKMHPDRLEVFSTLREVTGFINIQGDHQDFTNLSYFRNLEVIGGRQLLDTYFASLYIVKTNLKSLELRSLRQINSGAVVILENKNLCFANNIDWKKIKKSDQHDSMIINNKDPDECRSGGQYCSDECTEAGCWGAGPDQCLACKHVKYNGTCFRSCQSETNLYTMPDKNHCGQCHPECKRSCSGPEATDCLECEHVRDGKICLAECPKTKYARNGTCFNCHETCTGCTGPRDTIGANGCITCEKAIINDNKIERCLRERENCPVGYYYEYVFPQEQSILKPLAGKAICRKCHPRCKRCTGYGFHSQVCQECAGYKRGEQCEDECPTDHYADDERRECFACHGECRGCSGPGPDTCVQCQNFKIYNGDPNDNSTLFNCTATCPPEFPYKMLNELTYMHYCSAVAAKAGFASGESTETIMYLAIAFIVLLLLFAALIISSLHCRQKAKIKKEIVNTTRMLSGCEDAEPLRPSNVGANLSQLIMAKVDELSMGPLLGRGAFGEVYRGYWKPEYAKDKIPVAIKQLTNVSGDAYGASKEFLDEAMMMASVRHGYILRLLAVCMADKMMLITPLMTNGSLLEYVKSRKGKISSLQLLTWSTQIAKGMAHLEERRLVHRDLAARNVLVSPQVSAKIADFGLAKLLSNDNDEYKAAGGKMPIKWLALECIRHRIFTTKSDVWAFGVTIWELLTFGKRPFENIPARNVPEEIEAGVKLKQPDICSLELYCTLLTCWQIDADSRPTFKDLVADFQKYASDPSRYLAIQGDTQYTSHDEKRTLARQQLNQDTMTERNAHRLSQTTAGPSNAQPIANALKMYNLNSRAKLPNDDETDSHREICIGNIRLDLPLDDDDYLMPTCQSEENATPGYMDLLGTPAPACVDNPEYLMNTISTIQTPSTSSLSTVTSAAAAVASAMATSSRSPNSPPTQTIGIPVMNGNSHPSENVEQDSDREYYNDLQRELQPLQTNETTV
ncbi:epidermal growth factor receptor [Sitodiplosis mosellana]|uniref:epidermal growth factor receptor n=1 Tax=Sitodiplosis mosellana TaxID=263140 RepID=UPI00244487D0|nr:epidermal growth factor receptor [Sitodiplosis mosellana]